MGHAALIPSTVAPELPAAERDMLRLIVAGHTDAEIARRLDLAESEVCAHLLHIFALTGCDSRHQLAAAWPLALAAPSTDPAELARRIDALTLQRNALRRRCAELQEIVEHLSSRPVRPALDPHPSTGLTAGPHQEPA